MKKQGVLIYNHENNQMDIRFGLLEYHGELRCGEQLEVLIDDDWIPTTIENDGFWYLKGIRVLNLNGLIVRINK